MAFADVALTAYVPHNFPHDTLEPGLEEQAFFDPMNFTYPGGCHIVEVEVDPDTGTVKIDRVTACDDVGRVINPMIVAGQTHGGLAQGIGQALLEGCVYDENGQLLTGSYMDYTMPRADNLPMTNLANTITPSPHNPLGVKGAGEMGTIAATVTVANAVMDALAPAGITHLDMPLTAQKLHAALNSNGGGD